MSAPAQAGWRCSRRRAVLFAAVVAACPAAANIALAQSIWISPTSGNWSNPANWSGGTPSFAGSQFEVLTFNSAAAPLYLANNDLAINHQLTTLVFNNNGPGIAMLGGNSLLLSGSSGAQIGQEGTADAVINQDVNLSTTLTFKSGPADLTLNGGFGKNTSFASGKIGSGRVTLNGTNTNWFGPLTVNGGVIRFGSAASVTGGNISLSSDSIIENSAGFTGFSRTTGIGQGQIQWLGNGGFAARGSDFTISFGAGTRFWGSGSFVPSGSSLLFGNSSADHTVIFSTPISLNGGTRTISAARGTGAGPDAILTDTISNGTLIKAGNGVLQLNGSMTSVSLNAAAGTLILTGNNLTQAPTSITGGVLRIGAAGGLSPNTNVAISGGGLLEGSAAFTSLTRPVGQGSGAIRWTGAGGFSATGADLDVNLGGEVLPRTFGAENFVPSGSALIFASAAADHTVLFHNALRLAGTTQTITVNKGVGGGPEANLLGTVSSGSLVKNGAGTLQISSDISDLDGLTNASGTTILTGNNTYTGATTISGGALRIGASALSPNTNANLAGGVLEGSSAFTSLAVNTGVGPGQLQWTGDGGFSATGSDLTVNLNGGAPFLWGSGAFPPATAALLFGSPSADHTVIFQNAIDGGGGNRTINVTRGVGPAPEANITGVIGNNGTLIKTGDGVLEISSNINSLGGFNNAAGMTILSGTNNYGGQTTVSGGILRVSLAKGATSLSGLSNLNLAGGVVELTGASTFSRTLGTTGATLQWTGDGGFAALGSDVTVTWPQPPAALVWGSGSFVPASAALVFGSASADHTIVVASGFSLGGGARTIRVNKGVGTTPEVRFGPNTLISSGSLIKTGAGTMQIASNLPSTITGITNAAGMTILSGSNTYNGPTAVSGGILRLASSGALATSSHVVLSGGGIIEGTSSFTNFSRTTGTSGTTVEWQGDGGFAATGADMSIYWSVAKWGENGFVPFGSSLLFGSPNADHTVNVTSGFDLNNGNRTINVAKGIGATPEVSFNAPIFGTGSLIKEGPGTLQLSIGNSYFGNTIINAGTILANNSSALSNNPVIFNGGTLKLYTTGSPFSYTRTVTVNVPGGTINTNGLNASFTGAISGSGSFTKSGPGSLTVQALSVGPLTINDDAAIGRMIVLPRSATGVNTITRITALSIGTNGALDLNDNDLLVSYGTGPSPLSSLRGLVSAGYRSTLDPAATGIVSTTSQNLGGATVLALFDNALGGFTSWGGQSISPNTVVGKYTYFGDVNVDGQVNGDDYTVIDSNIGTTPTPGMAWVRGDVNRDGKVTGDDYIVVDSHLGLGEQNPLTPSGLVPSAVPEPAYGAILAALSWLTTRQRRQQRG